jgi:hypothetical protein
MKAIIFIPLKYTIGPMIVEGFEANGWEAKLIDYIQYLPAWRNKLFVKSIGLPNKLTKYIHPEYFNLINIKYSEIIENEKPDLILIYNNQYFSPELLQKIKNKTKITFYLGDHPLFSDTSDTNLTILQYSDYTISPDTYWKRELETMGIPNVHFDALGYNKKCNFKIEQISTEDRNNYSNDLVFVGMNYTNSAGYKRSLFYSQFADLDIKLYGSSGWDRWLQYFPGISDKFQALKDRMSQEKLNLILNCCKIYPIDQNPGIIHGIHTRVFEAIGSEILPLVEYREDIDLIFKNINIPVIKKYSEGSSMAKYFLNNEEIRILRIKELKEYVDNNYLPRFAIYKLLNNVFNNTDN